MLVAKKILVYDDEKHIAKLVEANLKRAGYEVVVSTTLPELRQKLESERPDMIVMEVADPGMAVPGKGLEFVRGLAGGPFEEVPVIVVTRVTADAEIFKMWQSRVASVLSKPLNPQELITFVGRVFDAIYGDEDEDDIDPSLPIPS